MKNKVRCYINNKPRKILRARVERNGTRAIDVATMILPRSTPVVKNDSVTYIQDPVDTTNLTGIWNFFDNTRDEGGYDLDADESSNNDCTTTYDDGCDGRVAEFTNSTTRAAKIANDSHIDFGGQFDIIIWATVTGSSSPAGYFFSKGNSDDHIKISHTAVSSNVSRAKLELRINGGTQVVLTGTNVNIRSANSSFIDSSEYHFIRVKRDENELVSLIVDGTVEGTATAAGIIDTNDGGNTNLYIGGDIAGANKPTASLAQIRLYSGGYLEDDEYLVLRQSRRQPLTMKFGGHVWKIEEKPTYKKIFCKGFAKILHDIEVDRSHPAISWSTTDKNVFKEKNGFEIMEELMSVFDSNYKVLNVHNNVNFDYNEYHGRGSLFANLLIISIGGKNDSSFSVAPRKLIRLEDDDIDYHSGGATLNGDGTINTYVHTKFSPITFKQGVIRVKDLGFDDTNTVTNLTVIGQIHSEKKERTHAVGDFASSTEGSDTVYKLAYNQQSTMRTGFSMRVWKPDGTELTQVYNVTPSTDEFRAEYDERTPVLGSIVASGNYTVRWEFENLADDNYYVNTGGNHSTLGKLSKTLYIPQVVRGGSGGTSLQDFHSKYLARFGDTERRFSVVAPTLLNNIRENYKVKIIDSTHGQATSTAITVKSMKFYYPEGITEVDLGSHTLDNYDIDNALGSKTQELRTTITKSQPY
jgi:hypothetical protein